MGTQPEARLQRRIRQRLKREVGGWWFKVWGGPFQAAGIPDVIGCVCGLFFAFEVKTDTGEPSDIQLETLADIRNEGGGIAKIIRTPEEAVANVLRALQKAGRSPEVRYTMGDGKRMRRSVFRARDR